MTAIALATPAFADFTYEVEQVGADVVINGSGSVDLTGLTPGTLFFGPPDPTVLPSIALIVTGTLDPDGLLFIDNDAVGTPFGDAGGFPEPDVNTQPNQDDYFGIAQRIFGGLSVYVPSGYTSGSSLATSDVYSDTTLAELGFFDSGSYTTTLTNGTDITVSIVPEPASAALAVPAALVLLRRRRQA